LYVRGNLLLPDMYGSLVYFACKILKIVHCLLHNLHIWC